MSFQIKVLTALFVFVTVLYAAQGLQCHRDVCYSYSDHGPYCYDLPEIDCTNSLCVHITINMTEVNSVLRDCSSIPNYCEYYHETFDNTGAVIDCRTCDEDFCN